MTGVQSTSFTLVHELIHGHLRFSSQTGNHSGYLAFSHEDMGIAAQKALVEAGVVEEEIPMYGNGSSYFCNALAISL